MNRKQWSEKVAKIAGLLTELDPYDREKPLGGALNQVDLAKHALHRRLRMALALLQPSACLPLVAVMNGGNPEPDDGQQPLLRETAALKELESALLVFRRNRGDKEYRIRYKRAIRAAMEQVLWRPPTRDELWKFYKDDPEIPF